MALLFFNKPRTAAAKAVNPKELYWSIISFGRAFTTMQTLSSPIQMQCDTTNNELREDAVCFVSWMASHVGNNCTEFQIRKCVFIILSFLGMKST